MSDTDKTSAKLVATTRSTKTDAASATPTQKVVAKKAVAKKAVTKKAAPKSTTAKKVTSTSSKKSTSTAFSHGRRVWPD